MYVPRKSHGVCYLNGFIYVIGGYNNIEGFLKKCERYDLKKQEWKVMPDLNFPASSPAIATFN